MWNELPIIISAPLFLCAQICTYLTWYSLRLFLCHKLCESFYTSRVLSSIICFWVLKISTLIGVLWSVLYF